MGIASWPARERPREKLLAGGPQALSDAELLAIFLRTGVRGRSAVDLGRTLIDRFGSLSALFGADVAAFNAVPGIGTAKYAQLQAAFELARRALRETSATGDALASPGAVRDYLRLTLENRAREAFVAVLLDAQHRVIAQEELFQGTLTQTSVYPREIVKCAMRHNAASVIFAHNHPSGIAEPSQADQTLTETLKRALALVDVRVLDHFVIGRGAVTSFAERGLI
ncbi:MAG: DNA repair protein RadC [Betaproteobacteria bacterium]|jgi:DNA repair protein RadC|nr:DNA repair protein RadC [Betaproteobacteria bacterium]